VCLAIYKPADVDVPEIHLQNGWIRNPDGAGYAYVHKGKVLIKKGFMLLKEFMESYNDSKKKFKKSPFLVHFRVRTQGDRSEANTHPFPIEGGALIHNGAISGTGAAFSQGPSDSAMFAEKYKDKLKKGVILKYKEGWDLALKHNLLVLLYDDGGHVIINEEDGIWDNGVWYSNSGFRPRLLEGPVIPRYSDYPRSKDIID
jgi:glutamine amidotransferase